jgi:NADH:ubiquinone oxidoreductase subunit H
VFLLQVVFVTVAAPFLTLLERRVVAYVHIRTGPNRVGFVLLFQPFDCFLGSNTFHWFLSICLIIFLLFFGGIISLFVTLAFLPLS